jgi:hypothetical protein
VRFPVQSAPAQRIMDMFGYEAGTSVRLQLLGW